MSHFLWIEDFENSVKTTASDVLSGIIEETFDNDARKLKRKLKDQGVFLELTFQDGLSFIRDKDKLNQIDYIILDIDLKSHNGSIEDISPDVLKLLYEFQDYTQSEYESKNEDLFNKTCTDLKKIAGFYLYTQLVLELGFPKTHILFCSNHGEVTGEIQDAFKKAKISLPQIYQKSNIQVQEWVKSRHDNSYSRLRRGIIEGCKYLKSLTEEKLRFNKFIQEQDKQITLEDLHNYLDVLENFLPLREPPDKTTFYKLFVRTLAHEWESVNPNNAADRNKREIFAFAWIMKMTRNWLAHSRVFENISEQDVAYLFIVNMRAMFTLEDNLLNHEKHLLKLFKIIISEQDLKVKISNNGKDRRIPLETSYAALLNKTQNHRQAINFHDALNNLQKFGGLENSDYLIQGLYQTFWFLTSSGYVYVYEPRTNEDANTRLNYQFYYFDYYKAQKDSYLFEFARHIYKRSFDG
jgi:hypothetical protein